MSGPLCRQLDCFFPSTSCHLGLMNVSECPHLCEETTEDPAQFSVDDEKFPWTARPFGLTDLRVLTTVGRPHVVGIAGFADAGKTTLLGMFFLMIYRGYPMIENASFAGSFTLGGWENISRYLQHAVNGPIQFPPHTTQTGRVPGLLHLSFSYEHKTRRDFLYCDAPGEWFANWTEDSNADSASGARWIAANADRLVVVADTAALTGSIGGPSRKNLEFLIRRLKKNISEDSIALVWTKSDLPRTGELVEKIHQQFRSCFPSAPIFKVQAPNQDSPDEAALNQIAALFRWTTAPAPNTFQIPLPKPHILDDPFMYYRGSS